MSNNLSKVQNAMVIEQADGNVGRLDISGVVGWDWYGDAWDAGYFRTQMDGLGDVSRLEVHINSPGGDVFDGIAIFNYLRQHKAPVDVHIDGVAASIAFVIAMAGDRIFMPSNTLGFIHKPWIAYTGGNADDLRKDAKQLDVCEVAIIASHMRHFKGSEAEMKALMDQETWFTASEMAEKFDHVEILEDEIKIAAALDMSALGVEIPEEAKKFLFEEDSKPTAEKSKGFGQKLISFLRGEGFDKAAKGLESDIAEEPETQEAEMTPEEKATMAKEIKDGILSELKEAGVVAEKKDPETPAKAEIKVEFEGDKSNPDDVQAYLEKVKLAQLEASVNWNDPKSIAAYHAEISPKEDSNASSAGKLPASNASTDARPETEKEQDRKDTSDALMAAMPSTRNK